MIQTRIFLLCFFIPIYYWGQFFNFQGNVNQIDFETYAITQDLSNQAGMMTFVFPADITQSFALDFQLNFGIHDANGGEGFAFVMSNNCIENLQYGGNLGIENLPNSLVVDFDTNFSGSNNNDIVNDHSGIYNNGSFSNGSNLMDSGPTPVCLLPNCGNVEDGNWHTARIEWNYVADNYQILKVYFDGVFLSSSSGNHRNQRFNDSQFVFWSITASTGTNSNLQQVKFYDEDFIFQTEYQFCYGDAFTLTAPPFGSEYTWSHNPSTTNIADYIATQTETIICSYLDYCGRPQIMEFSIIVETPAVTVTNNSPICQGEDAQFFFNGNPGDTISFVWQGNSYSVVLDQNGECFFNVPNAFVDQTITITHIQATSGCELDTNDNYTVQVMPPIQTTNIITN